MNEFLPNHITNSFVQANLAYAMYTKQILWSSICMCKSIVLECLITNQVFGVQKRNHAF